MIYLIIFCSLNVIVFSSDVFHVNSKLTFYPDKASEYFGFTVLLNKMGLYVGAPKAESRVIAGSHPGEVFTCSIKDLNSYNTVCKPLDKKLKGVQYQGYFQHDMWLGAALAAASDGTLLVCAPRSLFRYKSGDLELERSNSTCYVHGKTIDVALTPLNKYGRFVKYINRNPRKDYAEYYSSGSLKNNNFKYQQYGLFGMSATFTKNSEVLIGAPGVLEGAGTIFDYKYNPSSFTFDLSPSPNPYFTPSLAPDHYFGYSVDSGIFEVYGQVLYVAGAPRSKKGYGQVLIFEKPVKENAPLSIKAQLTGPHLGSYFGASLCTPDLNMDGINDLLVGAPNFVVRTGELTYDQGAVFVYLTRKSATGFILEDAGVVKGSGHPGARFGTSIADLGDIDGDGFNDVAIGAPWENNGTGIVYIYKGSRNGLVPKYTQRIFSNDASGFGVSISKGYDVDNNGCNDFAIGAFNSSTAYLYRCVPTMQVLTNIKVLDLKSLKKDASNFTVHFCYTVPLKKSWPNAQIGLNAKVTVDPERNRAKVIGESEYKVIAKAGGDICTAKMIKVNDHSDFSKPMLIQFDMTPVNIDASSVFPSNSARVSEDSDLQSSFNIQLGDCGDDLVCKPWLVMTLEPLKRDYIPGADNEISVKVTVTNMEEPAYSVKLHLVLPCLPKRLPDSCSLKDLDLMCDLPAPLNRNETAEWEIQLEYTWDGADTELMVAAELKDPLYMRNISEGAQELSIPIVPHVNYNFSGKAQPNATVQVTRYTFANSDGVLFTHYYEITNHGPSDLYNLKVEFLLSKEISPASNIEGSSLQNNTLTFIATNLKANMTTAYTLPLEFNLVQYGETLKELEAINVTSKMFLYNQYGHTKENRTMEVTTTLLLEPAVPLWPLIVALVVGILILAAIMLGLYMCGFFTRPKKEDLQQLIQDKASEEGSGSSPKPSTSDDSSSQENEENKLYTEPTSLME
ncbi:hypothetical protein ABMA27_002298 [Loxostege sticticalis]|uniref:Integrin alpha second immunoglobulin-like domain-containing protein n=1 Tax=Loxostege sticticalis TaxID=481309 RepID=A0ABR3HX98_LOXSC